MFLFFENRNHLTGASMILQEVLSERMASRGLEVLTAWRKAHGTLLKRETLIQLSRNVLRVS